MPDEQHKPHTLVVETSGQGRLTYLLRCPGVIDFCRAFEECDCPESRESDEWDGEDWFTFSGDDDAHGVTHRNIGGTWMRPTGLCWPRISGYAYEAAADLRIGGQPLTPGEYLVDVEFDNNSDESYFTLHLVEVS